MNYEEIFKDLTKGMNLRIEDSGNEIAVLSDDFFVRETYQGRMSAETRNDMWKQILVSTVRRAFRPVKIREPQQ